MTSCCVRNIYNPENLTSRRGFCEDCSAEIKITIEIKNTVLITHTCIKCVGIGEKGREARTKQKAFEAQYEIDQIYEKRDMLYDEREKKLLKREKAIEILKKVMVENF